jgi:hypothetical protein
VFTFGSEGEARTAVFADTAPLNRDQALSFCTASNSAPDAEQEHAMSSDTTDVTGIKYGS